MGRYGNGEKKDGGAGPSYLGLAPRGYRQTPLAGLMRKRRAGTIDMQQRLAMPPVGLYWQNGMSWV